MLCKNVERISNAFRHMTDIKTITNTLYQIPTCLICLDFISAAVQSKLQGREKLSFSSSLRMTDVNLASCSGLKWFFQSPTTPNIKTHSCSEEI